MRTDQIGANTSCLGNLPMQEAVAHIRRMGFAGISLLAFPNTRHRYGELAGFWFHDMSESERQWLKALVVDFQRISLHAPFLDLPLFSYDPRVEQLSLDRVRESIDAAHYLGAQIVTVHANARPNVPITDYWDHMVSTFRSLGEYAWNRGVRIGVETGFPTVVDQFIDLLEAVGHFGVGATLDCGHMARYVSRSLWGTPEGVAEMNRQLLDMTRQLGPMILHCQIHDVRAEGWIDHQSLGHGGIDFPRFLSELQATGYEGMLELELEEEHGVVALRESKSRLEALIRRLNRGQRPFQRRAA